MPDSLDAEGLTGNEQPTTKAKKTPGRPKKKKNEDNVSPEIIDATVEGAIANDVGDAAKPDTPTPGDMPTPDDTPAPDGTPALNKKGAEISPADDISEEEKDVLGEIGNICMGTSATTLSALVNNKVMIDTPKVRVEKWPYIPDGYNNQPCLGVRVNFTTGIEGANVLLLKNHDVKIIANLMMGGDGIIEEGEDELEEIDISAVSEAMNQMIGSSSTSLSSMIKQKVDIDTPKTIILNFDVDDFFKSVGFSSDESIILISFRMQIHNVIDSEIIQVMQKKLALDAVSRLKDKFGVKSEPQSQGPRYVSVDENAPAPRPMDELEPEGQSEPERSKSEPPRFAQSEPEYTQPPQSPPPRQSADVKSVQFQNFSENSETRQKENIDIVMDVPLEVTVELGRTRKKIREILEFAPGSVVELDKLAGEPIDIFVNGKFVARGEVVVIDENFGVRVTDIISPEKRI
jgi:flagellar motor switch protein FliN/FliY